MNPDGDTLGSMCAMYSMIYNRFKIKADLNIVSNGIKFDNADILAGNTKLITADGVNFIANAPVLTKITNVNALSIKDKSLPRALLENLIFPFFQLPLYAGSWVLNKVRAIPVNPNAKGTFQKALVAIKKKAGDLYGKELSVKILKKIRDEKRFDNLDELKNQIKKDAEECLK